jgi:two-component system, cell cycle response regulator
MNRRQGSAIGELWPLAVVAAGVFACSILLEEPWRAGLTAVLVASAGAVIWLFARHQSAVIASLRESATIDQLTGLLNRGGYEAQMELELARAARNGSELAFVVADIDNFKSINDRLGHLGGDMALERVGGKIKQTSRAGDVAARLGGDEFAIILPQTGEVGALAFADRLLKRIREGFSGTATDLTLSLGVALYPEAGRTAEGLLDAADHAMYTAKGLGKDRVAFYRAGPRPGREDPSAREAVASLVRVA